MSDKFSWQGALLVKADIKEAYRMIPVHPHDHHLLGVRWNNSYYVDRMLPFGLGSAPKIFYAVADAIQWMLSQRGITQFHFCGSLSGPGRVVEVHLNR